MRKKTKGDDIFFILIFIVCWLCLTLMSCKNSKPIYTSHIDTMYIRDTQYHKIYYVDSLVLKSIYDSIVKLEDSIIVLNNRIKYADYRNGRIVTKIQYYIDITDQRPKNKTFFFGWVKRAMRQEK
jgi:hypothetical protein